MRVWTLYVAVSSIAFAATAGSAAAQLPVPVSIEARFGAAVPRGVVAERWGTGLSFGVEGTVRVVPVVGVYAGYSYAVVGIDFIDQTQAVDRGWSVGLKPVFVIPGSAVEPWAKAGLLLHDLEIGTPATDGESAAGFEIAAGMTIPSPRVRSVHGVFGVGYRQYATDAEAFRGFGVELSGAKRETVSYFAAEIGLRVTF